MYFIVENNSLNLRRLIYSTKRESDDSQETILIPKNVLKHSYNYGFDLITSEDTHFYIFNKNIFPLLEWKIYLKQSKKFKENSINHNLIPYLVEKAYSSTFNNILINTSKNNKDLVNRVSIRCKLIEPKGKEFVYSIIDYPWLISVIEEIRKHY